MPVSQGWTLRLLISKNMPNLHKGGSSGSPRPSPVCTFCQGVLYFNPVLLLQENEGCFQKHTPKEIARMPRKRYWRVKRWSSMPFSCSSVKSSFTWKRTTCSTTFLHYPSISCTCQTSSNTWLVFSIILLVLLIPFIKLGPPIHMQLPTTTPKVWNYASKKLRAWHRHFNGQQSNPPATAHIAHVKRLNFLPTAMLSAKGLVKHQTRCDPKQFHWARMVV